MHHTISFAEIAIVHSLHYIIEPIQITTLNDSVHTASKYKYNTKASQTKPTSRLINTTKKKKTRGNVMISGFESNERSNECEQEKLSSKLFQLSDLSMTRT